MKINKINYHCNKLFSLKLLKTKIYTEKRKINSTRIKKIELHLKKALHIIYKYHVANKKILFIGTPLKENIRMQRLLGNTRHIFLPKSVWINGAISNSSSIIKHLLKQSKSNKTNKKKSEYLFNINNSYNLIVVLNEKSNNFLLKESLTKRIPIISFNYNDTLLNFAPSTYKIVGNLSLVHKKTRNNSFYTILYSILKRAENFKKLKQKINYPQKRGYKRFKT